MANGTREEMRSLEGITLATPPIPTEREWFDLFTGIAESLKTQADFVRED